MPHERLAIVAYYWPPTGGSGVQRWLKFVKYLPEAGWLPTVVTPERPSFDLRDDSLERDVPPEATIVRVKGWEPYDLFRSASRLVARKDPKLRPTELVSAAPSRLFDRLAIRVRGNLVVPDPKIFWARSAARVLERTMRGRDVRTLVTTGPPHSMHLVGLRLKRRLPGIRWIADFRDPWSEWGFLESLKAGALARARHRRLEAEVLRSADDLLTVTPSLQRQLERLAGRSVALITNGYDPADFESIVRSHPPKFTVRHVGTVNERCDPRPFLTAVAAWCGTSEDLRAQTVIEFVGEVHPDLVSWVKRNPVLASLIEFVPPVPHDHVLRLYGGTSVGLLVLTGYKDPALYLPGKLFEYFGAGLPVIGIGPTDGDAARAIAETHSGVMLAEDDTPGIIRVLVERFAAWKEGTYPPRSTEVSAYSRRSLTQQLATLLARRPG
jgi:hypothetical protein